MSAPALHHLELWTRDLTVDEPPFHWLLTILGWAAERVEGWPEGRIWRHPSGTYIVLEQSEAVRNTRHDRRAPGMNHLALTIADRDALDRPRADAGAPGGRERCRDRYTDAGGGGQAGRQAQRAGGL